MNQDRRKFIKTVFHSGLAITLFPSGVLASGSSTANLYAFIVDTEKCIGCGKCVSACKQENRVPDDCYRTWVERYRIMENGQVAVDSPHGGEKGFSAVSGTEKPAKAFFVPKLCNHCKDPNCVQVCPVGATYVSKDGFVLVDEKQCVACGYCIQACPYGARFLNPVTRVADKCTWCFHRVQKGQDTACVTVCPMNARMFGKVDDPAGPVYKILKEKRLQILKPETGNNPMAFYIGLDKEVR